MPNPIRMPSGDTEGGWSPLPAGTYDFEIKEYEQKVSSNDNPQVQVKMEVADGPHSGKKSNIFLTFVSQAYWKVNELLEALGIEQIDTGEKDDNGNPILSFDADELIGRFVRFEVEEDSYQGKGKNNHNNPVCSQLDPQYNELVQRSTGVDETPPADAPPAQQSAQQPAAQPAARPSRGRRPRPAS